MSEYVCVATNDIPPDETWTVKLHVTCKIYIIKFQTSSLLAFDNPIESLSLL